jgi:hypothetical protein
MKRKYRTPTGREQRIVEQVQVRPLRAAERPRFMRLLDRHHYLGALQPVGEQLLYVAVTATGGWVALLVFAAAAKHLKAREHWIGWTPTQKRKRLALMANNVRFLILPRWNIPNLGSRVLRLTTDRISADWRQHYAHPLAALETFVNPEQFQGTVYQASGWLEVGATSGYGRCPRDYYVRHNKPKRLFVKPLYKNAARSLQAEHLKPALAMVEAKVRPRCELRVKALRPLVGHFRAVPDFRQRFESYPLYALLAIVACAHFAGAPQGPCDLAAFAADLSQPQRRALGIRRNRQRRYPAPSAATFCRVLQKVEALTVEAAILAYQSQLRGPAPSHGVVALDGKEPRHSGGQHIVSAVNVPDLYYLGSEMVDTKTNEIPVARTLMSRLDLEGRLVGLDALHTQQETSREIVQEAGGDYLLTVKKNQPGIRKTLARALADIPASFSPSAHHRDACVDRRDQSGAARTANDRLPTLHPGTGLLPRRGANRQSLPQELGAQVRDRLRAQQPGTFGDERRAVVAGAASVLGH